MKWADERMLEAVRTHMPERYETLRHIFMAERSWMARLRGADSPATLEPPADLAAMAEEWAVLHRGWLDWAAAVPDWSAVVEYKLRSGAEMKSALWQIVFHAANHGSYHRGQVSAQLRAAGFVPPATDLILWYRDFPASGLGQ